MTDFRAAANADWNLGFNVIALAAAAMDENEVEERSRVIDGHKGEDEIGEFGQSKLSPLKFVPGKAGMEVFEPEISMEAAAEVVEASAVADTGSGWLCIPSYVVIK
ncbi:Hypothetical predicted protein [Olea europaea subsp. europaea]|uniref:Uncharacterized protein n=1 Tax=Olea europaea subsp. europaea TaxID=158383 RepID=A0A8S0TD95_OLEEU|nr:Hypothetical predicted protein [Olea europaea subsp. europaea]